VKIPNFKIPNSKWFSNTKLKKGIASKIHFHLQEINFSYQQKTKKPTQIELAFKISIKYIN
jgi:hypothetical protein